MWSLTLSGQPQPTFDASVATWLLFFMPPGDGRVWGCARKQPILVITCARGMFRSTGGGVLIEEVRGDVWVWHCWLPSISGGDLAGGGACIKCENWSFHLLIDKIFKEKLSNTTQISKIIFDGHHQLSPLTTNLPRWHFSSSEPEKTNQSAFLFCSSFAHIIISN